LEELKKQKEWAAEKWKEYQIQNVEGIFDTEKRQAEEEYKVRAMHVMMCLVDRLITG
jgi:hypothetical protein